MAIFKVGQRVRITVPGHGVLFVHGFVPPAGQEGIIVTGEDPCGYYGVSAFNVPPPKHGGPGWKVPGYALEPLTRPGVHIWAADKVREVTKPTFIDVPVNDPAPCFDGIESVS